MTNENILNPEPADSPSAILNPQSSQPQWPDPVNPKLLLDELRSIMTRFVVLPNWAAETLALWTLHTYAYQLRDVSTYLGVESPEKRCGKTTLLTVLTELVNRPIIASNISSPAFFRVIEEVRPTLMIDEADTLLQGNDELRGILNSGYSRKTAFVVRVTNGHPALRSALTKEGQPSQLAHFSCWCPKAIAAIGRLPETLADRCIVISMQRKTTDEQCERLRNLDGAILRRKCARFIADHAAAIASATPTIPPGLNDRAADIWEPLFILADLAGGDWPETARQAAVGLTAKTQENVPSAALLLDIATCFLILKKPKAFSRDLVACLNQLTDRPWFVIKKGKEITDQWLAQQLRPYGIRPANVWIEGTIAKGYVQDDFATVTQRYLPAAEIQARKDIVANLPPDESPEPDPTETPTEEDTPEPSAAQSEADKLLTKLQSLLPPQDAPSDS